MYTSTTVKSHSLLPVNPGAWQIGQAEIERKIAAGALEKGDSSIEHTQATLKKAEKALVLAQFAISIEDADGALDNLWTAARKTMEYLLACQGLRSLGTSSHLNVSECFFAQFCQSASKLKAPLTDLRTRRHDTTYTGSMAPEARMDEIPPMLQATKDLIAAAPELAKKLTLFLL